MEKKSKPDAFVNLLAACRERGSIPERHLDILKGFYTEYLKASHLDSSQIGTLFATMLTLIEKQCLAPFTFEPFHRLIRKPFDYYQFGIDFVLPLVDLPHSSVRGQEHLNAISSALSRGDNVIFLANHQVEADPQVISILLEKDYPLLAEQMIFVAGERVVTDPLAAPFSMGRNLLCIYSKRYIDYPPEDKGKKQHHNKRTMQVMSELLAEGGKAIYVAPSGGRDRANASGLVEIAPFDPQSIEMFYLMAQKAGHPTHFYPMALKTYDILPPPEAIQVELGEARLAQRSSIHLAVGSEIDMETFPGSETSDRRQKRAARALYIRNLVLSAYNRFPR
jgi:glycerol-3-phosphate O-acyltransferase